MLNLLLGGHGLIGTALGAKLAALGEDVVTHDLKSGFDLRYREPAVAGDRVYCWFLAWDSGGANYIMNPAVQLSILRRNLELCASVFGWIERTEVPFTFVSTQMVNYPNAYGLTKAVGECWARNLRHGLIGRLWNVYGPEPPSDRSHVIPDLVRQGANGGIRLQTSGVERRQFIHVEDCVEALILQRSIGQSLADVTSNRWISVREVAQLIGELMAVEVAPGAADGYESLVEPGQRLEGWAPRIDLRRGLVSVIEEMRERGWC